MFCLRDNNRYGLFSADSSIGRVQVSISICGFGESIEVYKNKESVASEEYEEEEINLNTKNNKLYVGNIEIKLPFRKCLKRYK